MHASLFNSAPVDLASYRLMALAETFICSFIWTRDFSCVSAKSSCLAHHDSFHDVNFTVISHSWVRVLSSKTNN